MITESEYIKVGLLISGSMFFLLNAIGVLRFPDYYTRTHPATKAPAVSQILFALAVMYAYPAWAPFILIIMVMYLLTDPTATHELSRAAYHSGEVPMHLQDAHDDLRKHAQKEEKAA